MTDKELAEEIEWIGLVRFCHETGMEFTEAQQQIIAALRRGPERPPSGEMDLATAYALAQTEIKGHMRIEDELKARIAGLEKTLELWDSGEFAKANARWIGLLREAEQKCVEAQSRIAELEKDAARLDWFHAELKLTIAHALHWPVTPQDTISFRAKIDAAIKDRA